MDWKERKTSRATMLARVVGLVTLAVGLPLLYWTVELSMLALFRAWEPAGPPRIGYSLNTSRYQFHLFLQEVMPFLFLFGLLGADGVGRVVDHVGARGGHLDQPHGDRPDGP